MKLIPGFLAALSSLTLLAPAAHATMENVLQVRSQMRTNMNASDIKALRQQISQARYADDLRTAQDRRQNTSREDILKSLKAGDVVLVRSGNLLGSIAARASDVPGQFAHLIFIAEDPSSHQLKAIESGQGEGVSIDSPDKKILTSEARIGLFRFKDSALAQRAAEETFKYITQTLKTKGAIEYDNNMDLDDNNALYCTEVATLAFRLVGEKVPSTLSHAHFLDPKMQKKLSIKTLDIFTPQDLELDPRFTLVAEYRDVAQLQSLYVKDAVMGKYFDWIASKDLGVQPGPIGRLAGFIGSQFFTNKLKEKMGSGSSKEDLSTYIKFAYAVYTSVTRLEEEVIFAVKNKDTRNYTVEDYNRVLEEILRERKEKAINPTGDVPR